MKEKYQRTQIELIEFLEEDILNGSTIIPEEDETPVIPG